MIFVFDFISIDLFRRMKYNSNIIQIIRQMDKMLYGNSQLVKSLSQLDINLTTLIMLNFTAILAIGLVLKGLRACWPKLDGI